MSVDTNTIGKNLAAYQRVRHPEFVVLVSPVLIGLVSRFRVTTSGRFLKRLVVELSDEPHRPVYADGPECC
ncbi:MAG: hypothetical protein ACO225_02265 [Ilumatobacteraceae bacterium]